jgi:hypothetical protein
MIKTKFRSNNWWAELVVMFVVIAYILFCLWVSFGDMLG